jgi:hypothetical protein
VVDTPNNVSIYGDEIYKVLIFGNPETRRKFLKQIAGTSEAITLGPRLLGNFQVASAVWKTRCLN